LLDVAAMTRSAQLVTNKDIKKLLFFSTTNSKFVHYEMYIAFCSDYEYLYTEDERQKRGH